MLPASKLINISIQNLVLHEQHPAASLGPEVRQRLINIYVDPVTSERRVTKRALLLMSQLNPINVVGKPDKPLVISGWSLLHTLKCYNVEDVIPCTIREKLAASVIHEVVLTDFFLSPSSLELQDEIAKRIKAICMQSMLNDADLRELIAPNASNPKLFFSLPERRRGTLDKEIREESLAVREFIDAADKPLGTGGSNEKESKKDNVSRAPIEEAPIPSIVKEPIKNREESSQPYQDTLFPDGDR